MKTLSYISLIGLYLLSFIPMWVGEVLFWLLIIFSFIWFLVFILLIVKKSKMWKRHLLLSPFIIYYSFGLITSFYSYFSGNGTLYLNESNRLGYSLRSDFNFQYRLYNHDYAGEHYGAFSFVNYKTYFTYLANDISLKCLVNVFGYQRKMYKGVFPAKRILYNDFTSEKIEKVYLDTANIGFAKFKLHGKYVTLTNSKKNEAPVRTEGGYEVLETLWIPIDSLTYNTDQKKMRDSAYILIMSKYYPLVYNVCRQFNADYEYQIIDAINQKVISTHRLNQD